MEASYDDVLANIQERDRIDSTRRESPLRRAEDAFDLNNDTLGRDEQLEILLKLFEERSK